MKTFKPIYFSDLETLTYKVTVYKWLDCVVDNAYKTYMLQFDTLLRIQRGLGSTTNFPRLWDICFLELQRLEKSSRGCLQIGLAPEVPGGVIMRGDSVR